MQSEEVRKRELEPLWKIRDNYDKLVLSLDPGLDHSYDGIRSESLTTLESLHIKKTTKKMLMSFAWSIVKRKWKKCFKTQAIELTKNTMLLFLLMKKDVKNMSQRTKMWKSKYSS